MIARLANVVYWSCTGTAILFAVGSVLALPNGRSNDFFGSIALGILAVGAYGFGRAVRYILVGK